MRIKFDIYVFMIITGWINLAAGGLLIPEGIRPVVSASTTLTWFINLMFSFLRHMWPYPMLAILSLGAFDYIASIFLKRYSTLSVHDDGISRSVSCAHIYLRIYLNLFSVHGEINSKMCTHCVGYARVCTTFLCLFRMNRTKNFHQSL